MQSIIYWFFAMRASGMFFTLLLLTIITVPCAATSDQPFINGTFRINIMKIGDVLAGENITVIGITNLPVGSEVHASVSTTEHCNGKRLDDPGNTSECIGFAPGGGGCIISCSPVQIDTVIHVSPGDNGLNRTELYVSSQNISEGGNIVYENIDQNRSFSEYFFLYPKDAPDILKNRKLPTGVPTTTDPLFAPAGPATVTSIVETSGSPLQTTIPPPAKSPGYDTLIAVTGLCVLTIISRRNG
jgi:hypothetical protein